jgi:hypothetical protein
MLQDLNKCTAISENLTTNALIASAKGLENELEELKRQAARLKGWLKQTATAIEYQQPIVSTEGEFTVQRQAVDLTWRYVLECMARRQKYEERPNSVNDRT